MIGKWKGAGSGEPGAGQGAFSFLPELKGQTLVRRSVNQLASGPLHEDLMIDYLEGETPAIYFDSSPRRTQTVFESYVPDGKNLNGKFEVGGKTYLTWTTVKD